MPFIRADRRSDRVVIDHSVSFDLDQPVTVNKARNFYYGAGGPYASKILAMDTGHRRPVLNANEQNPGAHHLAQ
jgi:hypothetical protein